MIDDQWLLILLFINTAINILHMAPIYYFK